MAPAAALLVLGLSLSASVGAQSPTGTSMYIKMLEAMVRRLGGQLPSRPEISPAASASPGVQCGAPPGVVRASTSFTSRHTGAQARFSCDIGFGPGEATAVCQPSGQWSPVTLICNPVDCGLPTTMVGGVATYEGTTYGSSVTYRCKAGFSNVGGTTVAVCQESGLWSKPSLTCAPTSAPNVDKLRSLLTTFQNSPLAARLPPEMRAMLSKSQQVLNSYSVTMPPSPTRPAPLVPSAAASSSQGSLPPHMMAMLNSMKASMPPSMKAMLNNAVPTGTVSPSLPPTSAQPKNNMQNMQNMMNTMQQMQMMRMIMSSKTGGGAQGKGGQGNAAMDPEAIAEAAADSMQRNLMLGMATGMMPGAMGMGNPLAALMGGANPLAALRNAYNQNLKNDPFAFPATSPGSPGSRTDPFLFEVPRTASGTGQQNQNNNNNNNMNPVLMAALLGNGQQPMNAAMRFMGMLGSA